MSAAVQSPTVVPPKPTGLALMFGWRRMLVVLVASTLVGLIISPAFPTLSAVRVIGREFFVGLFALVAFGFFEQWPRRMPAGLARWALQVCMVAFAIPVAVLFLYSLPYDDPRPWWQIEARRSGFLMIMMTGLLFAPWISVAALFRQTEFAARSRELAFDLERSELERKALDAHLRLLQAQVEPHFLFNTLANVRELVVAGAPQAATVLDSLIAYLRAAVPRLHEPATTMGQELELVRAYLELMHMRMPDRLQFDLQVDAAALPLRCPPTTLLTLVENAVRHGIDPSEEGGRITVRVQVKDGRCRCEVTDTGAGLERAVGGLGTGLATLLERLQLVFAGDAHLNLTALHPQGARAELDFPAAAKVRMTDKHSTALIADDEPLLRTSLMRMLAESWPELKVVAEARNGREAVEQFESLKPDICFLDVHMPGLSGVEAARQIGRRAHLVFVTAYDQYAVQAFEQEAIDYLVKPLEAARFADTVARLKARVSAAESLAIPEALLEQLAARLKRDAGPEPLRFIHASVGSAVRVISVDDIDFLRSDEKYTLVAYRGEAGKPGEALIRMPLKELVDQLDEKHFVQVHRSVVVNRRSISHVTRVNETAQIHLKGREEVLPVSRTYSHLFQQM